MASERVAGRCARGSAASAARKRRSWNGCASSTSWPRGELGEAAEADLHVAGVGQLAVAAAPAQRLARRLGGDERLDPVAGPAGRSHGQISGSQRRMAVRLTARGESANAVWARLRGPGRARSRRTSKARAQLDGENASSPPTPVITAPPAAASKIGSWKYALQGHSRPWRRSTLVATGPTQSRSPAASIRTQSSRPRCSITCSCHSVSCVRSRSGTGA